MRLISAKYNHSGVSLTEERVKFSNPSPKNNVVNVVLPLQERIKKMQNLIQL